jgi:hypothetical protein
MNTVISQYTFDDYIKDAVRTESTLLPLTKEVEQRGLSNRLFHAILGLETEIKEMYDVFESGNTDLDIVNLMEECGDAYWYLAIAFDELKIEETTLLLDNLSHCANGFNLARNELSSLRITCGEVLDHCKKVMFYGKQLDTEMVSGHIHRAYCLVGYMVAHCNYRVPYVLNTNIAKLKARYPEKFTATNAEVRDLDAERAILEKGLSK